MLDARLREADQSEGFVCPLLQRRILGSPGRHRVVVSGVLVPAFDCVGDTAGCDARPDEDLWFDPLP